MANFPICLRPWIGFELDDGNDHWGHVRPCCWALRYVGDIHNQDVGDIWNGSRYQDFRRHMLSGDLDGYCPSDCPNLTQSSVEWRTYIGQMLRHPSKNHVVNLSEIIQGAATLRSTPIQIKVTPTLACNLDCIMCYQVHDPGPQLPAKVIADLLALSRRAQLLRVQGGEIFASKRGMNFLEQLAGVVPQPAIAIITNGTFPIANAWTLLERLNLRWVMVSLDAATSDTYTKVRIGGNWDAVLANVQQLCKMSRAKKHKFTVYLSCTLMTVNYHEVPTLVELAHEMGADVCINPLTPQDATRNLDLISRPDLHKNVRVTLANALGYAQTASMPFAQSSIRMMLEILDSSS